MRGGPLMSYRFDEADGAAVYVNSGAGGASLNLDRNGTSAQVTGGHDSLIPSDAAGNAIFQAKDSPAARRNDNVLLDRPVAQAVSIVAWVRPMTQRSAMMVVGKPAQYALSMDAGGKLRGIVSGQTDLNSPTGVVWPGERFCIADVWDPNGAFAEGRRWALSVDGLEKISRTLGSGLSIPTGTQRFEVGGQDVVGSDGFWGYIDQVDVWYAALHLSDIQTLVSVGHNTIAETYGSKMNVFAFSRLVAPEGPAYRKLTNASDTTIFVANAFNATLGDLPIFPGRDEWVPWTGGISAIHRGQGPKTLYIRNS